MIKSVLAVQWTVHPLFFGIFILSLLTGFLTEVLILFAIVILHECGHLFAAILCKWSIRSVRILPIGGVLQVNEHELHLPAKEQLFVALAGPMQHIWMYAIASVLVRLGWLEPALGTYVSHSIITIGLFNLLPLYPLDGSKVVEVLLTRAYSYLVVKRTLVLLGIASSCAVVLWGTAITLMIHGKIQLNATLLGLMIGTLNVQHLRDWPYVTRLYALQRIQLGETVDSMIRREGIKFGHGEVATWLTLLEEKKKENIAT